MSLKTKTNQSSKDGLRNFNQGLVESLEIGQNQLVVSLERLKSKYKTQDEIDKTIKQLAKPSPRPKRKVYPNVYHVNEGDPIWNGNIINNVNDINVKPAILHQRQYQILTRSRRTTTPRTITRKIKKCQDNTTELSKTKLVSNSLSCDQKDNELGVLDSDTDSGGSYNANVDLTKPSERNGFKEIIQKSKKQKLLKDESVFEDNLKDTYLKRLRDSGNIRSKPVTRSCAISKFSQVKPESEFWNTRGEPLLGYDFIAGTLDNSKISVLSLPEKYFENLQKFREDENLTHKFVKGCNDNNESSEKLEPNSPICVHKLRLTNNQALCNVCKIISENKKQFPEVFSQNKRVTQIHKQQPKLNDKITYGKYNPKSMALRYNCSKTKNKNKLTKVGCTLGHF